MLSCGDKSTPGTDVVAPPTDTGDPPPNVLVDQSDEIFDNPLLDVELTVDPQDWETIRNQYRPYYDYFGREACHETPVSHSYDYFDASIKIDGEDVGELAIRKKGFIGSQTNIKPSLKLQFNRSDKSKRYKSMKRLTLNNVRSDPSHMRTCLAYHLFETSGVPASRCTFAKVSVNGDHVGVYAVVEEVKKDYLTRRFESDDGNLYEATINDFRAGFQGYEVETKSNNNFIGLVTEALETGGDVGLEDTLSQYINLDEFYRYWATEVMMWQRGGYSGNINNYFMYGDPSDQNRLRFLPWGPDNVMKDNTFVGAPDSVLASGLLSSRLYEIPEARQKYYTMLENVLESTWKEDQLKAWIDERANAIRPALVTEKAAAFEEDVLFLKNFVDNRKSVIAASRVGGEPEWINGLYPSLCHVPVGQIRARITSTWGTVSESYFTSGSVEASLTLNGEIISLFSQSGARAGFNTNLQRDRIQFLLDTDDLKRYVFSINLPLEDRYDPITEPGSYPLFFPAFSASGSEIRLDTSPATTTRRFQLREGTWAPSMLTKIDGDQIIVDVTVPLFEDPNE